MRVLAMLAISAAALPLVALADPAQAPAVAPATTTAQTVPASAAPTQTMATQATAPVAAPSSTMATADAGVDLNKIVCRSTPPPTGSRLGGGRECHTVREWNERMREDQRLLEQHQSINSRQGN